jgi:hypothetical protein
MNEKGQGNKGAAIVPRGKVLRVTKEVTGQPKSKTEKTTQRKVANCLQFQPQLSGGRRGS